jgi:hypothetical protein
MKNKIAIASAFLAATSFSMGEIVVNDFLSFEGFVDSSYSHTDRDSDLGDNSENSFQVDQVEISWLFNFDTVTAQIDLQYEGDSLIPSGADGELVEQAFVNFALGNGDVITAGRYASMLGFEAYEPTGLYQYSTAYVATPLKGYAQGVKYTRESDTSFFGISIQDEAFNNGANSLGGNEDVDGSYAVEVAYAQDLGNGFAAFIGAAYEDADDLGDSHIINAYVTYETGAWLFAAEVNSFESDLTTTGDVELLSGLLMANYAYNDTASVTARVSIEDSDTDALGDAEIVKYTLAHNKALADNLALIVELSLVDADTDIGDADVTEFAVELLFTF